MSPSWAVVVCPPTLAAFPSNYGREVAAARALAARGYAVQRIHYRGTGNSDGDATEVAFEASWRTR